MADFGDNGQIETERDLERAMQSVGSRAAAMQGERFCLKCGLRNDRARDGYSVCTDCVERQTND